MASVLKLQPEQFFAPERNRPFQWGVNDCVSLVDRWILLRTGKSFLQASGFHWSDKQTVDALFAEYSMPIEVARAMRSIGLKMTTSPDRGDVALIVAGPRIACAVKGGSMWLFRTEAGICSAPHSVRALGAWGVK